MPSLIPTYRAPAAVPSAGARVTPALSWGTTPLFDHTTNQFLIGDSGDMVLGNEATTLSQWVINALITPRLRHYIHRRIFGSDFDLLYGMKYPDGVLKKIAESYIRDSLQDSRITSIKKVESEIAGRLLAATITVVNANGFDQQFQAKWSVR